MSCIQEHPLLPLRGASKVIKLNNTSLNYGKTFTIPCTSSQKVVSYFCFPFTQALKHQRAEKEMYKYFSFCYCWRLP